MLQDDRSVWQRWVDGFRAPHSLTALIPLDRWTEDTLAAALTDGQAPICASLANIEEIHAVRLVAVPGAADIGGARLLLNVVYDGDRVAALRRVGAALGPLWAALGGVGDVAEAILAGRVPDAAFFVATHGATVVQIREEQALREALRAWVAEQGAEALDALGPAEARRRARAYVVGRGDLVHGPPPPRGWAAWLARRADLALVLLYFPILGVLYRDMTDTVAAVRPAALRWVAWVGYAVWWVYAAVPVGLALLWVRLAERFEAQPPVPPADPGKVEAIEAIEDTRAKNELTVWFPVREGRMARLLMRIVLYGSELGTRHLWTDGRLAGAENIHFARLVLVDGARTMVFMSDYQGSFDGYIEHFVGIGGHSRAVVPISSRLAGCPPTRWLYGKVDPPSFRRDWRRLIRVHQRQAGVWYVAYPELSANDILANRRLRIGLFADGLGPRREREWTRLV